MHDPTTFALIALIATFLAGTYIERWRARIARQQWQRKYGVKTTSGVVAFNGKAEAPLLDSADQLRVVINATFEKRRLLSKPEAQILYAAEKAIKTCNLGWRVMAQVSLGEVLTSPDARAYSTINSKRVDLLIVSRSGYPIAAVEYQGRGHYQGSAPARDAVKKEALRRAGVRYIEVTPEDGPGDVMREITKLETAENPKPAR